MYRVLLAGSKQWSPVAVREDTTGHARTTAAGRTRRAAPKASRDGDKHGGSGRRQRRPALAATKKTKSRGAPSVRVWRCRCGRAWWRAPHQALGERNSAAQSASSDITQHRDYESTAARVWRHERQAWVDPTPTCNHLQVRSTRETRQATAVDTTKSLALCYLALLRWCNVGQKL